MLVVLCLTAVAGVRALDAAGDANPTDVVATVGDTPIFRSELDEVLRRSAGSTIPGLPDPGPGPGANADKRIWLEALAIEQLIDSRLLRAEIEKEQITVGRLDVETRLEQLKKQVAARGLEWQAFLKQSGREERAVREQVELEIALDRLVRPKLTPAALAAGLERHRRELDGTRLRVSHILLRPDAALGEEGIAAMTARAATIRREIVQGLLSFADAAKRYSAGPSRLDGGDLGWLSRDTSFVEGFAQQAFNLAKGDVSKPFTTPFGVHLLQVTDVEPGRIGVETLRPKLESLLAANLLRETIARLRAATPVTFAAGIAHFDPATPASGDRPRRIVVGDASAP